MSSSKTKLDHLLKEVRLVDREKFEKMTKREKQIMSLWVNGQRSELISSTLNISKSTVSTHRKNIIKKTKLKSPKDFVLFALAFDLH